jgi:predicted ferric reductase
MVWKLPKTSTTFEKVDERTLRVQFAKAPLSISLGMHKCGQYVFINFPSISWQEWHPFSVASGPDDPNIDIYIRASGDHTKKILAYAEKCTTENKPMKIRSDGPYGSLPFNHRRYGSILFVAGGIGVTPIMSVLRDVYGTAREAPTKKHHCIKEVTLVWIMRHASEASMFLKELNSLRLLSTDDPLMPQFNLSIHATRDTDAGKGVINSRPNFDVLMNDHVLAQEADTRSILVYACGPSSMVKQLWDASAKKKTKKLRIDFYHETFEF